MHINACTDRLQCQNGAWDLDWRELVETRMKESALPPGDQYESRAARGRRELAVARRIAGLPPGERLEVWKSETGTSKPALHRRLAQLSHFSQVDAVRLTEPTNG
jgi:hypothetical protein